MYNQERLLISTPGVRVVPSSARVVGSGGLGAKRNSIWKIAGRLWDWPSSGILSARDRRHRESHATGSSRIADCPRRLLANVVSRTSTEAAGWNRSGQSRVGHSAALDSEPRNRAASRRRPGTE